MAKMWDFFRPYVSNTGSTLSQIQTILLELVDHNKHTLTEAHTRNIEVLPEFEVLTISTGNCFSTGTLFNDFIFISCKAAMLLCDQPQVIPVL